MEESRILEILRENYGFQILGIEFFRKSGGKTYIVNSVGQKFFLKIAGSAFQDTFRQSIDIVCYLYRNGFPVPDMIETKQGRPFLETCDEGKEYLFVLYEYIDGQEPNLEICGEKIGELVGWLHKLLLDYKNTLIERDDRFFVERYMKILRKKNYPFADTYAALGAKFWERVKDCPMGVCHGDLHRGNMLETAEGKIYLLDFDTACLAPRMFDVMVMCDMTDYFNLRAADIVTTRAVFQSFLAGYTRYVPLTEREKASFSDWVVIRHFQLQATIVEIFGMDCIDNDFIDSQLQWMKSWEEQSRAGISEQILVGDTKK